MFIFLDIDGVMVHANPNRRVELEEDGFYKFNTKAVNILKSVIYKTKDKVILSTSHRYKYNINRWKEIFETRGIEIEFLIIMHSHKYQFDCRVSRKTEILEWITDNKIESEELVIIDDDKSLNDLPKHLKDRLVLTNSYTGLDNIDNLKSVINRRLKKNFVIVNHKF